MLPTIAGLAESHFLAGAQNQLESMGVNAVSSPEGHLRAELEAFGTVYAVAYFICVNRLLAKGLSLQDRLKVFNDIQRQCCCAEPRSGPLAKDLYLVLLADEEVRQHPDFGDIQVRLEQDQHYAKKIVCSVEELGEWVGNPFSAVDIRANEKPLFTCLGKNSFQEEAVPSQVPTASLRTNQLPKMLKDLEQRGHKPAIQKLATKLLRRVLGADYDVVWGAELALGRLGDKQEIPVPFCSSGEQTAVAFSLFLALHHDQVVTGMCLEFMNALNSLDTLRHLGALDCIRDFAIATGASIQYESVKTDLRDWASRKLQPAMVSSSQVDEYFEEICP